jgi:hypothetical protein
LLPDNIDLNLWKTFLSLKKDNINENNKKVSNENYIDVINNFEEDIVQNSLNNHEINYNYEENNNLEIIMK